MKKKLLFLLGGAFLGGLFSLNASAQTDVTDKIANADFASLDGWTQNHPEKYWELGNGLIGSYAVANDKTSTTDDTHLATEYCLGMQCRWSTNFANFTQEVASLPAGAYTLSFDVENTNASNAATYNNLFTVKVGETTYIDEKKEWMNGASGWTTHTISFSLTEAGSATISLGYGTGSNNLGSGATPHLYVSHLKLTWTDPLVAAKAALQAEIDKAKLCAAEENLGDAISAAEAALTSATTIAELDAALAALQVADKDAVLRYENGLADAKATAGVLTSFVVNGDFTNNVNGWERTGGFQNNARASNQQGDFTVPFWENWHGSAMVNKMYQTIVNIPNGTYKLKIAAFVNNLADPNDSQFVFANADKVYLKTGDPTFYEVWTVVTTNAVEIGLEQTTATANWMGIDNVSLTYYGAGDVRDAAQAAAHKIDWDAALAAAKAALTDVLNKNITGLEKATLEAEVAKAEPTTASGYDEATAALTSATNTFVAAKDNYDALVNEIAKAKALGVDAATAEGYAATPASTAATVLTGTQALKVAEYDFVTTTYQYGVELGSWTTEGPTGSLSDQHYKGAGNPYLEQSSAAWGSNAWTIKYSQDVTLPAGDYVFKVAGRQANSKGVTLSLVVKVGDTTLGTVDDFPKGDTGLGINMNGATDFTTGEGHEYANGGAGRAWEWRYVKFSLSSDATVNVAVHAEATIEHMWVSFCDATVQTNSEANISAIQYNIALNDAQKAKAADANVNVKGEELTALEAAIAADKGSTKESIDAATLALTQATAAFTAAAPAYDAFVAAKAVEYAANQPYAKAEKFDAIAAAQSVADPASAADAQAKTAAILSAYRKYVESNALAEGVDGAVVIAVRDANMEVEYDGEAHTFGAWQVFGQTNGNIQLLNGESFTDGDGKNDYKYADIYKSDNNAGIQQTINLEPGKYLLTVTARAATTNGAAFWVFAGEKTENIQRIGNTGGTFDRGWNDASVEFTVTEKADVNIGVQSGNGKDLWWSATRFRLVKLSDAAAIEVNAEVKYATFIAPFDVEIPEGVKAYTVDGATNGELNLTPVSAVISANTPVLLESEAGYSGVVYGKGVATQQAYSTGLLTGVYVDTEAPVGSYVLQKHDDNVAFFLVGSDVKPTVTAGRCYITVDSSAPVLRIGGTTNIANVENTETAAAIYDLQGRRVDAPAKGIYVVNGKKVLVK